MELELSKQLQNIGCVQKGEFKLKDGTMSPYYIDLRRVVAHPDILKEIGKQIHDTSNMQGE